MHIFGTDTSSTICVMVMPPFRSEMFGETFSELKTGMVSDKCCVGLDIYHILLSYQSYTTNFIIYVQNICIHGNTPIALSYQDKEIQPQDI
jgi:hypothetical protein